MPSAPVDDRRMADRTQARIRVGISGWRYEPWRGVFYPDDLPQRFELRHAAGIFPTIEINGSFYSLQRPSSWRQWYDETPEDFLFAVKGPRFITHMLRLKEPLKPLANFLASGLLALRDKLGPILWQFPPNLKFNPERFAAFLELLPRDTEAALRIARRRDTRMRGRSVLTIDEPRPLRHAMEIRNESFLDAQFIDMLREHNVALVIAETARLWPMPRDVTADFMYLRLHGDEEIYRSGYRPAAIARWAERIRHWHAGGEPEDLPEGAIRVTAVPRSAAPCGRDVFCYFDNTDVKLRAPQDAQALMRRLGLTASPGGRPALDRGDDQQIVSVAATRARKTNRLIASKNRPVAPARRATGRARVRNSATGRAPPD
jgi:uncharacterized protein YecE (DUF72 family)